MTDQTWKVVAKNGVLVREGQDLKSPEASARLGKGAVVRELELQGERLRFALISGDGPPTGWASVTLKGTNLLVQKGTVPKQVELSVSTIPAPPEAKGMCIWLLTQGTRDEVQALVALGGGAKKAGYRVRLFAPKQWEALATTVGLDFTEAGLSEEDTVATLAQTEDPILKMMPPVLGSFWHFGSAVAGQAQAAPPDLVLYAPTCMSPALAVHEWLGVTIYPVWFRLPDIEFVSHLYFLDEAMQAGMNCTPIKNKIPEEIIARILEPKALLGTTSLELEVILDEPQKQRYTFTHKALFTGRWAIPDENQLQLSDALGHGVRSDVEAFLKAGKPPIYVGWGERQMEGSWATGMVVSAAKAGGFRAVIVAGRSNLSEEMLRNHVGGNDSEGLVAYAKANVLFTSGVSLEWVLPKCCCAMITGGSGVFGSCMHAGVPILVSPAEGDDSHYAALVTALGTGKGTAGLVSLEQSELRAALKFVATDSTVASKVKEAQKTVSQELGVAGAMLGINAVMKNDVASGATRRAWQEAKRLEEEAAESDEEPTDGVLRPPTEVPAKKPEPEKEPVVTPGWLKPDGKGKILIFTIPLKGHIIHLIRVAQWFLERPGYEVTMVCSTESVPDIPKGVNMITYQHNESFSKVDEMLAKQAHLDEDEPKESPAGPSVDDDVMDMLKKIIAPVVDLKPDVFVTDHGLNFLPAPNFIPALCKVYKCKCIFIVSPSIKENRIRQYKAQVKLATNRDKKPVMPYAIEEKKSGEEGESIEQAMFKPDENGVPNIPFKPENMSMMKLMQVFRAMPTISASPPITIYPSSHVLYKADRYDNELFAGAFLPLPRPVNGAMQHGRADLEGSMSKDLLDWLFASEDPVVYVAFGTIVSKYLPPVFVKRVVEALNEGPWRVIMVVPESLQEHLPSGLRGPRWYIEKFAPQADILRCERVCCFISHCGANSTMESMACGVPLVCMPFYMDQFDWSWAVRRHCRAAVQISCHSDAAAIRAAVSEVVTNTAYRENARKVALRMAGQADAVLAKLGDAMKPKARLGPGVTVLASLIIGLLKGEDVRPIMRLVDQSLPA